jgi:hypothetical protein
MFAFVALMFFPERRQNGVFSRPDIASGQFRIVLEGAAHGTGLS